MPSGSGRVAGSGSGVRARKKGRPKTGRSPSPASLDEGRLELRAVSPHGREELVLLEDLLDLEERHRGLDLLRAAAAAVALHPGVDEAEHVGLERSVG